MDNIPSTFDGQALATTFTGEGVTHVIFILDRSGSMSGKEDDVIGGFNGYIDTLRDCDDGDVGVSYLRFDNAIELVWNDLPLADVPRMTHEHYQVRGNTALLDAVGMTVASVRENAGHRYIVITNTDGQENASREWTAERVRHLIREYEAKGNWTFVFFGEGIDAWAEAAQYGYAAASVASYGRGQYKDAFLAKARVSNVMRKNKMRSTRDFARATRSVMDNPDISDAQVEQILNANDGPAEGAP